MTDHPLFPEMQDDSQFGTPAQPMEPAPEQEPVFSEEPAAEEPVAAEEESIPTEVNATEEPLFTEETPAPSEEPDAPTQEPVVSDEFDPPVNEPPANEPVVQEPAPQTPFAQPYMPQQPPFMQQPIYYGYPPYAAPQPVQYAPPPTQPKFDPYTGKPVQPPKQEKAAKPEKKKKSKGIGWGLVVFGLCIALIGGLVGGIIGFALAPHDDKQITQGDPHDQVTQNPTQTPTQRPTSITTPPSDLSALYEQSVPSIVGILNEFTTYNYFGQASTSSATGTGFIISSDGEILTNYHVIEGAQKLTVTMYDGTEYPAEVLGFEAESDVALIKVDATDLPAVVMGDSDALMVGEQITAIGNPLGELTYTMTVGYVSAKSRAVYTDEKPINMMQIDAAINPGNSGGPLFNMNGEVVGITTAKYSGTLDGSATIEGIGFAIPINDVLAIVDDLREFGSVQNRAYMGVTVTNNVAGGDLPAGAMVQSIERGGAGDEAGLLPGDIIVGVGSSKVYGIDTLYQALRPYRGGDTVELTVYRSGETLKLNITFGAAPASEEPTVETPTEPQIPTEDFPWGYFFP